MSETQKMAEKVNNLMSVLELKRLLIDLQEKRPDICVRYRLLGEMWVVNAMGVFKVTDKGVILNDQQNKRLVNVTDLSSIMQFEIDAPFQGLQPHFHYDVRPLDDFNL